ncbi:hypothetical protein [Sorangium sp. So ce128]|uniref:hypothetical protein n=1 Tax=Sorangium sp. So ce128 TaxID=3133281 RepID=UPI003F5FFC79
MHGITLPIGAIGLSLLVGITACHAPSGAGDEGSSEAVASSNQALTHDWSLSFREPYSWIIPQRVAVDGSGNSIMVGWYGGSADFGGTTFFSAGYSAGYVAAFSSAGSHLWSKSFDFADVRGVATDSSGNVVITGVMGDDGDFGGGTVTNSGAPGSSLYVAKYNSSGTHIWSYSYGSGPVAVGNEIAIDSSDNVILVGQYDGNLTIGSDSNSLSWGGSVLAKFDSSGTPVFARFFEHSGASSFISSSGVAADLNNDSIAVTGAFITTADFGGGTLTSNTGGTGWDAFVAKFDSSGTALWSKSFGNGDSYGLHVVVDSSGNPIVAGQYDGTVDFGINTPTLTSGGSVSTFVTQFDSSGTDIWTKGFIDAHTWNHGLATNSSDDVILTGNTWSSVNFGGGALGGYADVFVAQWDTTGTYVDSVIYDGGIAQVAVAVAVDSSDNTILLGQHGGSVSSVDFGGGPLSYQSDGTGELDVFLAHMSP